MSRLRTSGKRVCVPGFGLLEFSPQGAGIQPPPLRFPEGCDGATGIPTGAKEKGGPVDTGDGSQTQADFAAVAYWLFFQTFRLVPLTRTRNGETGELFGIKKGDLRRQE